MTTTAGTTLPTAPDLLIEAADTIGNRSAERDNGDGERSMNRAVQMFNAWRGQRGHSPMCEADGWAFMVFLKLARAYQLVGALNRQINRRARAAQPEDTHP